MKAANRLKVILIGIALMLVVPILATAQEPMTIEGSILKLETAKDYHSDGFVLVTADDTQWYLPNVPSSLKVRTLHESVIIEGQIDRQNNTIQVERITNNGKILWCQRGIIYDENAIYPAQIPDLCS